MEVTKANPRVHGLDWPRDSTLCVCPSCTAGKAKVHRKIKVSLHSVKSLKGELVYSDMSGKIAVPSKHGAVHSHTLIDSHSRMQFEVGVTKKSELTDIIEDWLESVCVGDNADMVVKEILVDGDRSNYKSQKFQKMLQVHHVKVSYVPEYESAYAGVVERGQGSIDCMAQAMLDYAQLDYSWYISARILAVWIRIASAMPPS